jgi:hypothetical protein
MHVSGISSSDKGTLAAASSAVGASAELQALFSKLHLDAATALAAAARKTVPRPGVTPANAADTHAAPTGLVSGLRDLFDGGLSAVSTVARTAEAAASAYATGGGVAAIGHLLVNKLG